MVKLHLLRAIREHASHKRHLEFVGNVVVRGPFKWYHTKYKSHLPKDLIHTTLTEENF